MALPGVGGQQRPRLDIVSPVGRFISGDLINKRTVDADNRPITDPAKHAFHIGLAVPKNDPAFAQFWQQYMAFAQQCYGNNAEAMQRLSRGLVGGRAGGLSLKIKDGDQPNRQGVINENSKGMFVLYMSTTLPIRTATRENQLSDPTSIKRGYWVDVAMSIAPNFEPGDRAGFYLNPSIVRLIAYGDEIVGGLSPEQAFANAPATTMLPPGASMTPVAPVGGMPGYSQPQQPGFTPPGSPGYPQPTQGGYGVPPSQPQGYPQQPGGYAPNAGVPSTPMGSPYPMGAAGPAQSGMPTGAPNAAYPSSIPPQTTGGYPQPGFTPQQPGPAYGQPGVPGAGMPPMGGPGAGPVAGGMPGTGYPIDPRTGQPVQPHPQFLQTPPR